LDYTKDENLMRILSELANEVKGWEYSVSSRWKDNEKVIANRRQTINESITQFKRYINTEKE
jgi:hypothetical protein